jgi:glucokinase
LFIGVDVGGTKTAVVLSHEPPHVIFRAEFATEPERGPAHALDRIVELAREAIATAGGGATLRSIGVSCGGPLNHITGVIHTPPNLPTWVDVPIKQILETAFDVPCHLENDANAGALAEHRYGAGAGCQQMAFLTMGTGLGAGLILNGQLFYGASAMAGEIGHVRLTPGGPRGYNKEGSVEGWASGAGVAQHGAATLREALSAGETTTLAAHLHGLSAKDIGMAAQAGDPVAMRIVANAGSKLGEAIAILVDVINPERVVVGGLALRLGDLLLDPARRVMRQEALAEAASVCTIVPASLGESIGDVAALCAAQRT